MYILCVCIYIYFSYFHSYIFTDVFMYYTINDFNYFYDHELILLEGVPNPASVEFFWQIIFPTMFLLGVYLAKLVSWTF